MESSIVVGGALVCVFVGAAIDLRTRRIPNLLTLGGAVVALSANAVLFHEHGVLLSLAGWVAGVGLLIVPFALGGMGAGDVKLLALAGAWGGPWFVVLTVLYGAIAGAVMALGFLTATGRLGATLAPALSLVRYQLALVFALEVPSATPDAGTPGVAPPARRSLRIPYGPALAIGALVATLVR